MKTRSENPKASKRKSADSPSPALARVGTLTQLNLPQPLGHTVVVAASVRLPYLCGVSDPE